MVDPQLVAFTGIVALLTITPGADTMLVLRNVLNRGVAAGLLATAGVCSGLFIHATLSALGVSLILVRSAAVFEVVKLAGACYLIFLGSQGIWRLLRHRSQSSVGLPIGTPGSTPFRRWTPLAEGLLTNVLNPKVAIFYLAFLPQFVSPADPVFAKSMLLAAIHGLLGLVWLSLLSLLLGRMQGLLTRPRVQAVLEATTSSILIAFGVRLALTRR